MVGKMQTVMFGVPLVKGVLLTEAHTGMCKPLAVVIATSDRRKNNHEKYSNY